MGRAKGAVGGRAMMTEEEWLTYGDPERLYYFVTAENESPRKSRLLGCACARRLWHLLGSVYQTAIEVTERYADGSASAAELVTVANVAHEARLSEDVGDTAANLARAVV